MTDRVRELRDAWREFGQKDIDTIDRLLPTVLDDYERLLEAAREVCKFRYYSEPKAATVLREVLDLIALRPVIDKILPGRLVNDNQEAFNDKPRRCPKTWCHDRTAFKEDCYCDREENHTGACCCVCGSKAVGALDSLTPQELTDG